MIYPPCPEPVNKTGIVIKIHSQMLNLAAIPVYYLLRVVSASSCPEQMQKERPRSKEIEAHSDYKFPSLNQQSTSSLGLVPKAFEACGLWTCFSMVINLSVLKSSTLESTRPSAVCREVKFLLRRLQTHVP